MMNIKNKLEQIFFLMLVVLLAITVFSCRGGEAGAYIIGNGDPVTEDGDIENNPDGDTENIETDGDTDTEYSEDSEDTEEDADVVATVLDTPDLACPMPNDIPYDLESSEFLSDSNKTAVESATFILDSNQDIIGLPDSTEQIVKSIITRANNGLFGTNIAGEWVSLFKPYSDGSYDLLGRVKTDDKGAFAVEVNSDMKFTTGNSVIYSVLEGDGSCAVHGAFLWPKGTQIIITDIDGTLTLSDDELMTQISDQSYDPVENDSAAEMVQTWAAKGYMIVYLTSRPHIYRQQTRQWFFDHEIPFGGLITADSLVFDESAREYKREQVNRIKNEYQWEIIAAYGNAESDINAYSDASISTDITFIIGENAGVGGTVPIANQDYSSHIANYINNQPDADQPF